MKGFIVYKTFSHFLPHLILTKGYQWVGSLFLGVRMLGFESGVTKYQLSACGAHYFDSLCLDFLLCKETFQCLLHRDVTKSK